MTDAGYTVVVGIDFSELGNSALDEAIALAAERFEATLHVVHVAESEGPLLRMTLPGGARSLTKQEAMDFLTEHVKKHLAERRADELDLPDDRAEVHVRVGVPSDELTQVASDKNADLVVVGTHGRTGLSRILLGSVAEATVRKAACPVLVIRPKNYSKD